MSDPSTATPSPELAFLDLFTVALIADPSGAAFFVHEAREDEGGAGS